MALQLLSLREIIDGNGVTHTTTKKHFDKQWRAPNIFDLFAKMEEYVEQIPVEERWNVYYTAANCLEEHGRKMITQQCIPFDIDGIDLSRQDEYIQVFTDTLGLNYADIGIVNSGNGLQFIVGLQYEIDVNDMARLKPYYREVCAKLTNAYKQAGLDCNVDTVVFSEARLLRLAFTKNDKSKKGKGIKDAVLLNGHIEALDFRLEDYCSQGSLEEGDTVNERFMQRFGPLDESSIERDCSFLRYCKENQGEISEPQWYGMLSIIGRFKDGAKLAQEYSEGHPNYSYEETNRKLEQALSSAGPRTCKNISSLFNGCASCPHFNTSLISPVCIKSSTFIATRETGFWKFPADGKGKPKFDYEGLMQYFESVHPFVSMAEGRMLYVYKNNYWQFITNIRIYNFVEENCIPKPDTNICKEFENKLLRNHIVEQDFFEKTGFVNMQNGVLDTNTLTLLDHDPALGQTSILPFAYDPDADCPRFKQFLREVTQDDKDLIAILEEFMGYSLSNVSPQIGQKALVLHGDGANGKSVFVDALCYIAGDNGYSALAVGNELNKIENRHQLIGKLFNVSEETPDDGLVNGNIFKALVAGGNVQVRKYYRDAFSMKNMAKLIMLCNEMPIIKDFSNGMGRRLLIVPFEATFSHENGNIDVDIREKLYAEASGIFNLAMKGLNRFMQSDAGKKGAKKFTESKQSSEVLDELMHTGDVHGEWIRQNIVACEGSMVSYKEIQTKYVFDLSQIKERHLDMPRMGARIKKSFPKAAIKRTAKGRQLIGYKIREEMDDSNRQANF